MKNGYYTSGEFAKAAHVTLRTIRWYDKQNILKPSIRNEDGRRYYSDQDLAALQQILLLKYLGFSLDDIREMTLTRNDASFLMESLQIQKKLVQERMEQLKEVSRTLDDTIQTIQEHKQVDWKAMLNLIHMTSTEESLKNQYLDATNISARIRLHHEYSTNQQGWFPWIFSQIQWKKEMRVLEIGCGNGALWTENLHLIPEDAKIVLSDISEGMLRDARNSIGEDTRFTYQKFDCHNIPYEDNTFDLVIANHVLFYCDDLQLTLKQCRRVIKDDGTFIASTYGSDHMHEITDIVKGFNPEIALAAESLYEKFGLENGEQILKQHFEAVHCERYEDGIELSEPDPLIAYILSCHGNQNRILLDHYTQFKTYVTKITENGIHITKAAGLFLCQK